MMKKYVVEFDIYTDGDCCVDFDDLKDHKSRYFEQDLYEYTIIDPDSYKYKVRRVFDNPDDALSFFDICDRISDRSNYFVTEILMERINQCIEEFWRFGRSNDFIDGNIEFDMAVYTINTNAKKIKTIIYEEVEKVKGRSCADTVCDPNKIKCPHCGHVGMKIDEYSDQISESGYEIGYSDGREAQSKFYAAEKEAIRHAVNKLDYIIRPIIDTDGVIRYGDMDAISKCITVIKDLCEEEVKGNG